MSFVENGKNSLTWIAAPQQRSVIRTPGCVHCGRKLEMNAAGKISLSGKCETCLYRCLEGDEIVDDEEY